MKKQTSGIAARNKQNKVVTNRILAKKNGAPKGAKKQKG